MAQTTQNDFLKSLGNVAEINKNLVGKKTEYGRAEVPAGIKNGIARLKEVKLAVHEASDTLQDKSKIGKYYFMATATVVEPLEFQGQKCANLTIKIGPTTITDTPNSPGKKKTKMDYIEWMCNHVRLLLGEKEQTWGIEKINEKIALLNEAKPHFLFNTSLLPAQGTNPQRVWHEWLQYVKYDKPINQAALVTQAPGDNGHQSEEASEPVQQTFDDGAEAPADDQNQGDDLDLDKATLDDLEKVIALCKTGNTDAIAKLKELGASVGVTEEQIDETQYWEDAEELIKKACEMPEEKPVQKVVPKIGNVYLYTPKGKGFREGKYEMLNLSKDGKTCKLRSLVTKKEVDGAPVSELKPS